jgi:hypothetical protein
MDFASLNLPGSRGKMGSLSPWGRGMGEGDKKRRKSYNRISGCASEQKAKITSAE